jgi:hypothetical protein
MSDASAASLAEDLIERQRRRLTPKRGDLGYVRRYLAGDHDLPYMPRKAKREYREMAERARTNWLPLISDTFSKILFVDGYRSGNSGENAAAWYYWQANGLDSRQSIVHRGALEYGAAYGLVLPGEGGVPFARFYHPTKTLVLFEDEESDWPAYGIVNIGTSLDGAALWRLYDETSEYEIAVPKGKKPTVYAVNDHGLGVTPLVRYRERLGQESPGIIRPLIPLQDRVNETIFATMIAIQYASFRQRWATGLEIPEDEDQYITRKDSNGDPILDEGGNPVLVENPNFGKPVEPFEAAVDRLWTTDSPDARFGDFSQTQISDHIQAYMGAVRSMAAIGQTSPSLLTGEIANLSAEALAALNSTTTQKGAEYETNFGESHEQLFRLMGSAAGDAEAASDLSAEVRWRDAEARSLAATVDALGKMVTMLQVPASEVWEKIPGVTDTEVERWKENFGSSDAISALAEALTRQSAPTAPAEEASV